MNFSLKNNCTQRVHYYKNSKLLFISSSGKIDSVFYRKGYPQGFEPNFDFWWNRKIYRIDTISTKRSFGKMFTFYSDYYNEERKKYINSNINVSFSIYYRKDENDNGLILSVDNFKEKFNLNQYKKNDTLIFKTKNYPNNLKDCNDPECLKIIKYIKEKGIVFLEKGNGEKWKLKN